jgi:hypothetical protein
MGKTYSGKIKMGKVLKDLAKHIQRNIGKMIPKLVMCQELAVYYMQFVISDFVKKNK